MKKVMFGLAAAAAISAFAIESANTVGYNAKAVEAAKFAILGVQFEATDGTTDINKIISGVTGVSQDELGENFVASAPHIQVPNGVGYDLYYYLTDGYYATGEIEDGEDVYAQKPGWCDFNGIIAGDAAADADGVLIPGVAIWIKDPNLAESFLQAGQVPSDSTLQISVPATFALRANAFPIEFNLNDTSKVTFSGLTGVSQDELGEDFVLSAPHIQVPNGVGYDLYYYLTDGYYATGEIEDGEEVYAQKPGWCDFNGIIAGDAAADATGIVPAGAGFWAKGVGSTFSITFTK